MIYININLFLQIREIQVNCLRCLFPIDPHFGLYGLHRECFTSWFKVPDTATFTSLSRKSSHTFDKTQISSPQNTSFFHGKFKKYSAELDGSSYILKMREPEAPELPEVEYLCNQIGELLEIPTAQFFIINFEGENVFVTKNFIKSNTPTDLQHIYHFRPDDNHSCEDLIQVIAEKTKRPYDVGIFIKTLLFDALIGNHDRHGRNLALIVTSSDTTLSPIYDNVSYLGLEKGNMLKADFNPTGKICTQITYEPNMRDYVIELKRLGYKDHLNEFYRKTKLSQLDRLIQASFCDDLMKDAITKLIKKRYMELENELKN